MNHINYKQLTLMLTTVFMFTACGGGTDKVEEGENGATETEVTETELTQCSITEGAPKTDSSITVKVVCSDGGVAIESATVTLDGLTKAVEYSTNAFVDYLGFGGLKENTSYEATLEVHISGEIITESVRIKTNKVTATAANIIHNGTMYGTVTSPHTGKVWLDRNLGAARVCTAINDNACYGDYYQWGRTVDGHEDSLSLLANQVVTDFNRPDLWHDFVPEHEWLSQNLDRDGSRRIARWSSIDGSSVCPIGFRVPTSAELVSETLAQNVTTTAQAYASFLKMGSTGIRLFRGDFVNVGNALALYSVSNYSIDITKDGFVGLRTVDTLVLDVNNAGGSFAAGILGFNLGSGVPVRCIQN